MELSYNGVQLKILTIDRADRRSVMTPDGSDVIYTQWDIACSAVYAPAVPNYGPSGTSVTFDGSARDSAAGNHSGLVVQPWGTDNVPAQTSPSVGTGLAAQPGVEGPLLTDRDIRVRLAVPRRPLVISGYDPDGTQRIWLQSPRPGFTVDAKNGPFVRATPVMGITGVGMAAAFAVEITTWEPPCPDGYDRTVLAHRWQMVHSWDEDYYLTRSVTGEIVFHGGMLARYGVPVERVTNDMFHPIPHGFKRQLGPVARSPDGLTVRYSYADTDQRIVFAPGASGATQIDIKEYVTHHAPGRSYGLKDEVFRPDVWAVARQAVGFPWNQMLGGLKLGS